jgi:hypothetical protein
MTNFASTTVFDRLSDVTESSVTDHWEVLGVGLNCSSPLGNFQCLTLNRERTVGGINNTTYSFSRGIGIVRKQTADSIDELVSCSVD